MAEWELRQTPTTNDNRKNLNQVRRGKKKIQCATVFVWKKTSHLVFTTRKVRQKDEQWGNKFNNKKKTEMAFVQGKVTTVLWFHSWCLHPCKLFTSLLLLYLILLFTASTSSKRQKKKEKENCWVASVSDVSEDLCFSFNVLYFTRGYKKRQKGKS